MTSGNESHDVQCTAHMHMCHHQYSTPNNAIFPLTHSQLLHLCQPLAHVVPLLAGEGLVFSANAFVVLVAANDKHEGHIS
jgi:hypothetical protein